MGVGEGLGNKHLQWMKTCVVLQVSSSVERENRGLFTSIRSQSAEEKVTRLASRAFASGGCKAVLLLRSYIDSPF